MTRKAQIFSIVLGYIRSFLIFFSLNAFVVTCSFLLFFSDMKLAEADVRRMAPAVFFNVCLLAFLCMVADALRRKFTVERPSREILKVLRRIGNGDFNARISIHSLGANATKFGEIATGINLLAEELAGVETLRTDFIANVSHELKTPLAVMQNYGTMLQDSTLSEKQREEYAKAITAACRRLADLITNILRLNKLENQQIYPAVAEYDLSEQLCACLLQFEDEWERKNITIDTDLAEGLIVRSDAELLSLVWNNLISNALKFTPEGGEVFVGLMRKGNKITVTVRDTGCGMSPEVGAHIFEKFYQGDTSHTTRGNGLGLALVKRVVDILHGEISVESVQGQGSIFTVHFESINDANTDKNL